MQRWGKLKWVMGQRMKLLPLPLLLLPALQGKMQWLQLMMGPLLLVVLVDLFGDPRRREQEIRKHPRRRFKYQVFRYLVKIQCQFLFQ